MTWKSWQNSLRDTSRKWLSYSSSFQEACFLFSGAYEMNALTMWFKQESPFSVVVLPHLNTRRVGRILDRMRARVVAQLFCKTCCGNADILLVPHTPKKWFLLFLLVKSSGGREGHQSSALFISLGDRTEASFRHSLLVSCQMCNITLSLYFDAF